MADTNDTPTYGKDPITTFRSAYYKRPYPYTGESLTPEQIEQNAKEMYKRLHMKAPRGNSAELRRKALLKSNAWLNPILEQIARARLDMLNSDDDGSEDSQRYHSKKYGWGHKLDFKSIPEDNEYFTLMSDPDTGKLWIDESEKAKDLMYDKNDEYKAARKIFEDYIAGPYSQELVPVTREEAEQQGLDWYPSTNEMLNALLATKLGDGNREALYDAAQVAFSKILQDDLASENPQYRNAFNKILLSDGKTQERQFKAPNGVTTTLMNMGVPFISSVYNDPELYYKTGKGEMIARGLADAGLWGASIALPWLGASRGMLMASRPLVGATLGGMAGGAANYGLTRGVNQAFDAATGHGGIEHPIDATDLAMEMALGGIGGVSGTMNRLTGLNQLRRTMKGANYKSVTGKDIKTSVQKAKQYGNKSNAENAFASEAFDDYEKAYPNSAHQIQLAPVPEGRIVDATARGGKRALPLQMEQPDGNVITGVDPITGAQRSVGTGNLKNLIVEKLGLFDPAGNPIYVPRQFIHGDDPEFLNSYIKSHKSYFDGLLGNSGLDVTNLGKILRKAQKKGSEESKFFTGGRKTYPDADFAAKLATYRGQKVDDETKQAYYFLYNMFKNKNKLGTIEKGRFKAATPEQAQMHKEANDLYESRKSMKLVDQNDVDKAFKDGSLRRIGKIPLVATKGASNALPFSNTFMGVSPYTYEAMPDNED